MLILFKDLRLTRWVFQRWFGRARVATFRDSGQEFLRCFERRDAGEIRAAVVKGKSKLIEGRNQSFWDYRSRLCTHGFFFV